MCSVKADAALICRRVSKDDHTRYIARCDAQSGKLGTTQPLSFAENVLRDCLFSAKAGSIWKWSDVDLGPSAAQHPEMRDVPAILFEIVVCPLESNGSYIDCLELHYRHQLAQHDLDLLTILLGTFTSSWKRRAPGIVTKKIVQNRMPTRVRIKQEYSMPLLDTENPAKLSRSEFRVCTLLQEGMTVNVIAESLSIGAATVRSHLSSIFSKTGACSQVELLHQLNCTDQTDTQSDRDIGLSVGHT